TLLCQVIQAQENSKMNLYHRNITAGPSQVLLKPKYVILSFPYYYSLSLKIRVLIRNTYTNAELACCWISPFIDAKGCGASACIRTPVRIVTYLGVRTAVVCNGYQICGLHI